VQTAAFGFTAVARSLRGHSHARLPLVCVRTKVKDDSAAPGARLRARVVAARAAVERAVIGRAGRQRRQLGLAQRVEARHVEVCAGNWSVCMSVCTDAALGRLAAFRARRRLVARRGGIIRLAAVGRPILAYANATHLRADILCRGTTLLRQVRGIADAVRKRTHSLKRDLIFTCYLHELEGRDAWNAGRGRVGRVQPHPGHRDGRLHGPGGCRARPPLSPHYHVRARRCRPHVLVLWPRPRLLTGVRVHTRDGQIAQAVDHCDNDKIKTIKYLNKLKGQVRPLRRGRRGLQARGKRLARGERHADEFANDFSRLGHPISREVWCTRCSECSPAARDIAI
jgi:hypothetical protein